MFDNIKDAWKIIKGDINKLIGKKVEEPKPCVDPCICHPKPKEDIETTRLEVIVDKSTLSPLSKISPVFIEPAQPPPPKQVKKTTFKFMGWNQGPKDDRDYSYNLPKGIAAQRPAIFSIKEGFSDCYDQSNLNSSVANSVASVMEYLYKLKGEVFTPSRLFIYFCQRSNLKIDLKADIGSSIRDTLKSVSKFGMCKESSWTYDTSKFSDTPPDSVFSEALKYKGIKYERVPQGGGYIESRLSTGNPIIIGIKIYESFESDEVTKNGVVSFPQDGEKCIGGISGVIVGYNAAEKTFTIRNSWGTDWGLKGYFILPYKYVLDTSLTEEFWTITLP